MKMEVTRRLRIAELNDRLRQSFMGGRVMKTASIAALPIDVQVTIMGRVRSFTAFTTGNDPHGEHDFGSFEVAGYRVFWKIDYYDEHMQNGSENPTDPTKTTRVLTIMLAEDY